MLKASLFLSWLITSRPNWVGQTATHFPFKSRLLPIIFPSSLPCFLYTSAHVLLCQVITFLKGQMLSQICALTFRNKIKSVISGLLHETSGLGPVVNRPSRVNFTFTPSRFPMRRKDWWRVCMCLIAHNASPMLFTSYRRYCLYSEKGLRPAVLLHTTLTIISSAN